VLDGANVVLWLGASTAYAVWIEHAVREEYRLGYRTSTDGDIVAIPIAGFVTSLGVALLAANLVLVVVRLVQFRRSRPVT